MGRATRGGSATPQSFAPPKDTYTLLHGPTTDSSAPAPQLAKPVVYKRHASEVQLGEWT